MAHSELHVDASPEAVFDVISDPRSFARWVVGSRKIRRADPDWPAPGTGFDHAVGFGPFVLKDHSCVEACERPRLLKLLVKLRPISRAHVTLRLTPDGDGAHVTMDEDAADARSRVVFNRLTDPLVRLRNAESLRRLKALAEGTEPMPTGPLPPRGVEVEGDVTASSRRASA